jgi:hypothetical protein
MKETLDNIITFLKGLAQPGITVMAVIVFLGYAGSKLFTPDQVYNVIVGVIVFWFGYTAFKFGIKDDSSPKADSPVVTGSLGTVKGWGEPCANCAADGYQDDNTDYSGFPPAAPDLDGDKVGGILDSIFDDAAADGLPNDVAYVSSHIVSYLGAHGDELNDADKEELIQCGINYAETAYRSVTGLKKVPATYAEAADYNKWWRENKAKCKAPVGKAKAVFMTLRDLLNRRDNP